MPAQRRNKNTELMLIVLFQILYKFRIENIYKALKVQKQSILFYIGKTTSITFYIKMAQNMSS